MSVVFVVATTSTWICPVKSFQSSWSKAVVYEKWMPSGHVRCKSTDLHRFNRVVVDAILSIYIYIFQSHDGCDMFTPDLGHVF